MKTSNAGGESKFHPPKPGMFPGRLYRIIDLGTKLDEKWGKKKHKILVGFELPTQLITDEGDYKGQPYSVGKQYVLSHNDKAILRLDLESWYGKQFDTDALDKAGGFDVSKLLGRPALLNLVSSDDGRYTNIKSINPLPDGMVCPPQVNASFLFDFSANDWREQFEKLSDKLKETVMESEEYLGVVAQPAAKSAAKPNVFDDLDSDPPF